MDASEVILPRVIRKVSRYMRSVRIRGKGVEKQKKLEHIRIKHYDRAIAEEIKRYAKALHIDALHPFQRAIVDIDPGVDALRVACARLMAVLTPLASVRDDALYAISQARSKKRLLEVRRAYLGRVADILSDISPAIDTIIRAKKALASIRGISFDVPTAVLAGYPNVGKSTLLKALTGSEPEIAPYPFTTRNIRVGHFTYNYTRIQVLDTPGMLDRDVSKMNAVEKKAVSALRHLAGVVVFVVDPLQDIHRQRALLTTLKQFLQVPVIVVVNKTDVADVKMDGLHVSALTGKGIGALRREIAKSLGVV